MGEEDVGNLDEGALRKGHKDTGGRIDGSVDADDKIEGQMQHRCRPRADQEPIMHIRQRRTRSAWEKMRLPTATLSFSEATSSMRLVHTSGGREVHLEVDLDAAEINPEHWLSEEKYLDRDGD